VTRINRFQVGRGGRERACQKSTPYETHREFETHAEFKREERERERRCHGFERVRKKYESEMENSTSSTV
jgi:hypothetical protein